MSLTNVTGWYEDGDVDDFSLHGINDISDLLADGSLSIDDFPMPSKADEEWKELRKDLAARGPRPLSKQCSMTPEDFERAGAIARANGEF